MAAPLTKDQKKELAMLARRAFDRQAALARGRGEDPAADFEQWRHETVAFAVGKRGLRCCSQDDYCDLRGTLHHLLGEDDRALYWFTRGQGEPRRQAWWKLKQAAGKAGRSLNYVEAICRQVHKCNLAEASADQLWKLYYTIRNRPAHRPTKP